jgi:RNA polymerase sigma-70 factor (ECF subfamily)
MAAAPRQAFPAAEFSRMENEQREHLTTLINEARAGSSDAKERLLRAVYGEFHRIADRLMRSERAGHTLQPSALVNEAVIRLLDGEAFERAPNRRYLLAAAGHAMRRILVDHARKRHVREGQLQRVPLDEFLAYFEEKNLDFIALDEALDRLSSVNERQGLVVVLRFFAGLTTAQVADVLDVSVATVEGDWRFARAWLRGQIGRIDA